MFKKSRKYEEIELTNMCMICDNDGNVVVQDKRSGSWGGITFPGGHIEKCESFVDSVIREVKEETGLDIRHPKLCGIKWWQVDKNRRYIVIFFKTNEYSGKLKSSIEGKCFWAKLDELSKMDNLAPDFDKMLEVFTNDDIQEHMQLKENNKWVSFFK